MPQVDSVKKRPDKKSMVVGVGAIGAVVLIIAIVLVVKMVSANPPVTTEAALNDASNKTFSGDNAGAIKILKAQLGHAKNNDEKVEIYLAMAAAYEDKGDKAEAFGANKKAGALRPGYGINQAIARTAEAVGDKATALDYYKRNRELIKSGKTPQAGGDLPGIEAAITRLGGTL